MTAEELKGRNFENEFLFSTSRSGGPGGQNVNKVSTKVELRFRLLSTSVFTEEEKALIVLRLKNKINKEREIIFVSQSERTQLLNREAVIEKFFVLVAKALSIQKKRKSTGPSRASRLKRLEMKKNRGVIKKLRKNSNDLQEL